MRMHWMHSIRILEWCESQKCQFIPWLSCNKRSSLVLLTSKRYAIEGKRKRNFSINIFSTNRKSQCEMLECGNPYKKISFCQSNVWTPASVALRLLQIQHLRFIYLVCTTYKYLSGSKMFKWHLCQSARGTFMKEATVVKRVCWATERSLCTIIYCHLHA